MSQRGARDANIELMRLAACFGVIMIHLPYRITRMDAITCNAVMMFFAITGCFWFKTKRSYGQVVLHFAETILLPLAIVCTAAQVLDPWFDAPVWHLSRSLLHVPDPLRTLQGVIRVDPSYWREVGGHLWYVSDFITLLLFYIPMRLVATHPDRRVRWGMTILCFVPVFVLDISHVLPPAVSAWLPGMQLIFPSYFVMMMMGQGLYTHRDKLKGWKCFVVGCIGFVALTLIRYLMSETVPTVDGSEPYLTLISLFSFMSLPFIFMIFMPPRLPEKLAKLIRFLASLTFGVYLVHGVVIRKLIAVGWLERIFRHCIDLTPKTYINYFINGFISSALILVISMIVVIPFHVALVFIKGKLRSRRKV